MLYLGSEELKILGGLIGSQLTSCASGKLSVYSTHAVSYEREVMMFFKKGQTFTNVLLTSDFLETEDGTVFYDYKILNNISIADAVHYRNAEVFFESSPIKEIIIYGREFQPNSFKDAGVITEYANVGQCDELFQLRCEAQDFLLAFDPFLPQLNFMFNPREIDFFFNSNESYSYSVHHRIA